MAFPSIHIEGGLIPSDLVEQIATGDFSGQSPEHFHLDHHTRLSDEIAGAWADARAYWHAFQRAIDRLPEHDTATTPTRQLWIIPLLYTLGYQQVAFMRQAEVLDGRSYAISHRAGENESAPPIHIEGAGTSLDQRPPSGRPRLSPHGLVQEYLNHSEHVWGIVTNGLRLRLIRDNALMSRQSYVEFDLEAMLSGEHFADFGVMYRLVHRTRLPWGIDDAPHCLLEQYYQHGVEQGGRVREHLRDGVEDALKALGNGFLAHPKSAALRARVTDGTLAPLEYYRQLLRLIYRFLFLLVSEERGLIGPGDPRLRRIYDETYSLSRLRKLVETRLTTAERYHDIWIGLAQTTFRIHEDGKIAALIGMGALDGDLFGPDAIPDLRDAFITNADLLRALRRLMLWHDGKLLRRVNYAALDVEELGSVYESLLDFHPTIHQTGRGPVFDLATGTERKTTGSYYTRPELVHELIKSALEPVIADRLQAAGTDPQARERALLALTVCDPACGSGHFLLAAARRIGRELATVRTGEAHPAPEATRAAIRDAIRHCIYGVDKNPLAVDLCKVALWLEGHNHDRPLSFLDHRIKCGDSLVGVFDLDVLREGIPDGAYNPVSGDDKKVSSRLKARNKKEREGQPMLPGFGISPTGEAPALSRLLVRFAREQEDTPDDVRRKRDAYERSRAMGTDWWREWTACNLWTAAFFMPQTPEMEAFVPTTDTVRHYLDHPGAAHGLEIGYITQLATDNRFFHWPLEFPEVFDRGGFEVVLGNPPWEMLQLDAREFFAMRIPNIAQAPNMAARNRLIKQLSRENPKAFEDYNAAIHATNANQRFVHESNRFPLTSFGRINLMALFSELARTLLNPSGRTGVVVPTSIATTSFTQHFFGDLVKKQALARLIGFENEAFIFADVHHSFSFCALIMTGEEKPTENAEFIFYCRYFEDLGQPERRFVLSRDDFELINPNTRNCPIFRTNIDAELTKKIYRHTSVLVNEGSGEDPWGFQSMLMFMMNTDSKHFYDRASVGTLPLYEAKMIYQFDHRYTTYENATQANIDAGILPQLSTEEKQDPCLAVLPRYWVDTREVEKRLENWDRRWLLVYRAITRSGNERAAIFSLLPIAGVGNSAPIMQSNVDRSFFLGCLLANMNCLTLDYVARQKIGGANFNQYILKQLPVLTPLQYITQDIAFIVTRVLELTYTAWDIKAFADDLWRDADESLRDRLVEQWEANVAATGGGHANAEPPEWAELAPDGFPYPPFMWDEDRRAVLRAELDAYYAHLYGLTHEELRYILDPADVYGPDFPGETFRVLKEKEIRQYGEYRTRRLVLEAWDRLGF